MKFFKNTAKIIQNKYKTVVALAVAPLIVGTMIGATSLAKMDTQTTLANQLSFGNKAIAEQIYKNANKNMFDNFASNVISTFSNDKSLTSDSVVSFYINKANDDYWKKMSSKISSEKDLKQVFETLYNYSNLYTGSQEMKNSISSIDKDTLLKGFIKSYNDYKNENLSSNKIKINKAIEIIQSVNPDYKILSMDELNSKFTNKLSGADLEIKYLEFLELEIIQVKPINKEFAQTIEQNQERAIQV